MDRLREAIRLYYVGGMTQAELYGIFSAVKTELGIPHNLIWTQYDQMLRTKGLSEGVDLGMAEGGEVGVTQPPSAKTLSTTAAATPQEQRYLEEDPTAAWYRAKGLPTVGGNPFQNWMGAQAAPAYSAYAGQEILNRQQGGTPGSFQSYLGEQGPALTGSTALGALQRAKGLTSEQQNIWRGQLEGEDVGGSLRNLLQAGIEGKGYASPFARAAVKNVPGFERQWQTETLGGGQAGSETLLAYLMKQLGLS